MTSYIPRSERRGVNAEAETTRRERIAQVATTSENWLHRHAAVLASFLAGMIVGYTVGAW